MVCGQYHRSEIPEKNEKSACNCLAHSPCLRRCPPLSQLFTNNPIHDLPQKRNLGFRVFSSSQLTIISYLGTTTNAIRFPAILPDCSTLAESCNDSTICS